MLYLPDDVFHLIMHYRNRLMRRDEVRELRKEMQSNKIEINNLKDEISELWEFGDEDEEEQLEAELVTEENQLEEFIEDLQVEVATIQTRIKHLKELDDFWRLSYTA